MPLYAAITIVSGYGLLLAIAQEVPVAWPYYETSWSHSETREVTYGLGM